LKLSIITICYNSESSIKNTIRSVEEQVFNDFEYIIIDGGSSDKTLEIIEQHSIIDKVISEPDDGIYDAFNKGIQNAKGEIVGVLNSDDTFFDKDSLNSIVKGFDGNTDCVFGDLIYTNTKNKIKRIWKGSSFEEGAFKRAWMPAHQTFYCKKSIYEKYGLFDQSYKIAGDFELMLRFLEKHSIKSKYIPKTLVNMRTGGVSNRSLKSKFKILEEEFRAFNKNKIHINKFSYIFHKLKKIKEFKIF